MSAGSRGSPQHRRLAAVAALRFLSSLLSGALDSVPRCFKIFYDIEGPAALCILRGFRVLRRLAVAIVILFREFEGV